MVRFDASRGADTPDATITPANVGQVTEQWTANLIGPGSDPVVADGNVFVTASNSPTSNVYAFGAGGGTNCSTSSSSSTTCSPVWTVPFTVPSGIRPGKRPNMPQFCPRLL